MKQWVVVAAATAGVAAVLTGAAIFGFSAAAGAGAPDRDRIEQIVREYLLANPELLVEMMDRLEQKQLAERRRAIEDAIAANGIETFFDPKVAFVTGPADAKETFVEFFDYQCSFCRRSVDAVKKYYETHPETRYAFIEFPILSPESETAARAAIASRRQGKYVEFHFALLAAEDRLVDERIFEIAAEVGLDIDKLKADMTDPAIGESIEAAHRLAERFMLDGTPTFIVNGNLRSGWVDEPMLEALAKGVRDGEG